MSGLCAHALSGLSARSRPLASLEPSGSGSWTIELNFVDRSGILLDKAAMARLVFILQKMEREPENGEPAEIKIIKKAYKKAFLFVNKGLNTDELGQKEEAKNYYKQGIGHLLRGISARQQSQGAQALNGSLPDICNRR